MPVDAANLAHELKPIDAGHHNIRNDDIRAVAVQHVGRLRGVCAADRLVTGGAQAGADDLIQAGIIFHNKHTNHVNPPSQNRKAGILGAFRCIRSLIGFSIPANCFEFVTAARFYSRA